MHEMLDSYILAKNAVVRSEMNLPANILVSSILSPHENGKQALARLLIIT